MLPIYRSINSKEEYFSTESVLMSLVFVQHKIILVTSDWSKFHSLFCFSDKTYISEILVTLGSDAIERYLSHSAKL